MQKMQKQRIKLCFERDILKSNINGIKWKQNNGIDGESIRKVMTNAKITQYSNDNNKQEQDVVLFSDNCFTKNTIMNRKIKSSIRWTSIKSQKKSMDSICNVNKNNNGKNDMKIQTNRTEQQNMQRSRIYDNNKQVKDSKYITIQDKNVQNNEQKNNKDQQVDKNLQQFYNINFMDYPQKYQQNRKNKSLDLKQDTTKNKSITYMDTHNKINTIASQVFVYTTQHYQNQNNTHQNQNHIHKHQLQQQKYKIPIKQNLKYNKILSNRRYINIKQKFKDHFKKNTSKTTLSILINSNPIPFYITSIVPKFTNKPFSQLHQTCKITPFHLSPRPNIKPRKFKLSSSPNRPSTSHKYNHQKNKLNQETQRLSTSMSIKPWQQQTYDEERNYQDNYKHEKAKGKKKINSGKYTREENKYCSK